MEVNGIISTGKVNGFVNKHVIDTLTHLHSESPAAFNELGDVLLTVAVAPRFLEKLQTESVPVSLRGRCGAWMKC